MDLFTLKIIGIMSMLTDHWHYIIGGPEILTIIGRLAYPIFAFSISEGYIHTKNFRKYIFRIGFSALLFQGPVWILKYDYPLNIFFTLCAGLFCIHIYNLKKITPMLKYTLILLIFYISYKFELDYGIYGLITIMIFNIFRESKGKILSSFLLLNLFIIIRPEWFYMSRNQIYSIFSLIPVFFYNGKKGKNVKYFFYIFYPLHFLGLELIRKIIYK